MRLTHGVALGLLAFAAAPTYPGSPVGLAAPRCAGAGHRGRGGGGRPRGPDPGQPDGSHRGEAHHPYGAGLDPSTVLRAATLDAATYLGKEHEFGSVEVGKRADLVLLEANPLEDIGNAARVGAVIVGGDVFDSQQLERMTADGCEVFGD